MGCAPAADSSTIDRRRWPSAMPGRLVGPHIARVGAAMLQDIGHGAGMGGKIAARARQQSGYAAHGFADSDGGKGRDIGAECGTRAGLASRVCWFRARGGRPVSLRAG